MNLMFLIKSARLGDKLSKINTLTLFCALLILSSAILVTSFVSGYQYELEATLSKSKMLSENVSSSVVFRDTTFADDILQSLNSSSEISLAIVYDKKGDVFSIYSKDFLAKQQHKLIIENTLSLFGLSVVTPITHNESIIGHVYLFTKLNHLYVRLFWFIIIIIISSIIAVYIGKIMLNRLNQSILLPLLRLTEAMSLVSQNINYNVQVPDSEIIELNILVDGFNNMLKTIRDRDESLTSYRGDLENKVKLRTKELKLSTELSEEKSKALELKNKELKSTQVQLIQSAKLASVGEMATGIAHELNQPLGIISMNADLRLYEVQKGQFEKVLSSYRTIIKQVERATIIINHLRSFGRDSRLDGYSKERIKTIINDSFIMLNEQFKIHDINVSLDITDDLPPLFCNRIQIEQVLTNLFVNAKDAMEFSENKMLVVKVKKTETNCIFEISDSGTGIDNAIIERIFDPFFTTKDVGKGTGLGLSISYGIIKAHQGTLSVKSKQKAGAIFKIVLPFKQAADSSNVEDKKGL